MDQQSVPFFKGIPVPEWWKGTVADINEIVSRVKRGEVKQLGKTAGGIPIPYVTYGEAEPHPGTANLFSASGALNLKYYADKSQRKKPVVIIVGGVHGAEIEGIVAVNNLIRLLETGTDLRGETWPALTELAAKSRLVLIPCLNMDGRHRCLPQSFVYEPLHAMRHWNQGTKADGSYFDWPDFKAMHPQHPYLVKFVGTGHNDDGINFMHDNFFRPFAAETAAILGLAEAEAPDVILQLHGGAASPFHFMGTYHVAKRTQALLRDIAAAVNERLKSNGYNYVGRVPHAQADEKEPPSMNLTSALYHACGGVSILFESYQGIVKENEEPRYLWDDICKVHMLMFGEVIGFCHSRFPEFMAPFI